MQTQIFGVNPLIERGTVPCKPIILVTTQQQGAAAHSTLAPFKRISQCGTTLWLLTWALTALPSHSHRSTEARVDLQARLNSCINLTLVTQSFGLRDAYSTDGEKHEPRADHLATL